MRCDRSPDPAPRRRGGLAGLLVAALAGLMLLAPAAARAQDGPPGPEGGDEADSVEAQVKAQMEKVLRLMRENEKALLEASSVGGAKPAGVEVKPPEGEGQGVKPPPSEPPPQGVPPTAGEDARRRLEEVLKVTQGSGGAIPRELEELVKLIPT